MFIRIVKLLEEVYHDVEKQINDQIIRQIKNRVYLNISEKLKDIDVDYENKIL